MTPEPFGKYTLISLLGTGGMAEVFLAKTKSIAGFEKLLAIKRLLPGFSEDQETVTLLADEARITVYLNHPNIVQVFDFGQVEKSYYIAIEYVDGLDLKSLIRINDQVSRPMPIVLALYITIAILDALEFAHTRCDRSGKPLGIIHRDVSPHNVLISRFGQVKLTDFGVARATISNHQSYVGDIRGKFSYMPPEQLLGGDIDRRVDVFAAGAILYELLSGQQPFRSGSMMEQLQFLNSAIKPPSAYISNISSELDAICLKALAKDPEHRCQTAGEFAQALREHYVFLAGTSIPPVAQLVQFIEERIDEQQLDRLPPLAPKDTSAMTMVDYHLDLNSLIAEEVSKVQEGLREVISDEEQQAETILMDMSEPIQGISRPVSVENNRRKDPPFTGKHSAKSDVEKVELFSSHANTASPQEFSRPYNHQQRYSMGTLIIIFLISAIISTTILLWLTRF